MSTWHADIALAVYFAKTDKKRRESEPDLCFTCAGTRVYKGRPCPDCKEDSADG